jgi:hypothetical protein
LKKSCPIAPVGEYGYHATVRGKLREIARFGLEPRRQPLCHADEDRCTRERVLFFAPTVQHASVWGKEIVRFPWPEESFEDDYGDTTIVDGEVVRTAHFTYDAVPAAQVEICRRGRWVPLLWKLATKAPSRRHQRRRR